MGKDPKARSNMRNGFARSASQGFEGVVVLESGVFISLSGLRLSLELDDSEESEELRRPNGFEVLEATDGAEPVPASYSGEVAAAMGPGDTED